jgi:hypothetical protein
VIIHIKHYLYSCNQKAPARLLLLACCSPLAAKSVRGKSGEKFLERVVLFLLPLLFFSLLPPLSYFILILSPTSFLFFVSRNPLGESEYLA